MDEVMRMKISLRAQLKLINLEKEIEKYESQRK